MSALVLCNMVLHIPDEGAERLDRFRECRDERGRDSGEETSSAEVPHEEEVEAETMDEDDREEEGCKEDDEGADAEDWGEESKSHSSLGSMLESLHSTWHYSDRHCCCPRSWAEGSESGNSEDGFLGELSISENSGGDGEGEVGCPQAPPSSPLQEPESLGEMPEEVGQIVPSETVSTVGNLPPAGSQDAIVVHTTEDEFRSLK